MPMLLILPVLIVATWLSAPDAAAASSAFHVPSDCRQLIVGLAETWDSNTVTLRRYVRSGSQWNPVGESWPGRLGADGLAWGRGVHPPMPGRAKREGDNRAPAGVFDLGGAYGYATDIPRHPDLPYTQVTDRDLWVEDPKSPHYNLHLRIEPGRELTSWETKQRMKSGDAAHSLKLFIKHNAAPHIVPGAGSSIFFHIWRSEGRRASAGCTTMAPEQLRDLIAWCDPSQRPIFVLLPQPVFEQVRKPWRLP